ncbi:hypothetical protein VKT23_009923 [Stygiomarasmius scandens]|uniref:C2H2-type domain-containing protein n=1 Tax=Marasmiellus scandens TaxID=2682957 RepID=A0ABR1JF97_9AGAR
MPTCPQCRRAFQSDGALRSHCKAKQDHHYCQICNSLFSSASLLRAHFVQQSNHGIHYCADCNRLISLNAVGGHLASRRHLRRATSRPNISAPTSIFSVSNAPSTPSVQGSPTTPPQPSPTSSQSVSFIMVSPLSPSSSQGTRAGSSDNDWNPIESDVNDHDAGVVNPYASSAEPILTSTASTEDETTLRERMEALNQQREAIAAQMRELERQEEEIGLEEQQIRVRVSSLENRMVAPLTPSIDSDANVSPLSLPTSGVVSSPTSDDSSQHHVFDLYTNSEHPYCPPCNRSFNSVAAFRTHCVDKSDHPYCLFCERWFASMSILQQHFISARNAQDPTHNYEPDSPRVTETRTEQTIEVETRPVQRQEAPRVPVISSRPESDTRCVICLKKFGDKAALDSHQKGKKTCKKALAAARVSKNTPRQVPPTPTIPSVLVSSSVSKVGQHYRCLVCSRNFVSQKAFSDHERTSTVHKEKKKKLDSLPTPDETKCPLCRRDFKFPSAVADHIESGACSNGKVTRHHVTAAVHAMNISPSITITKRIAGSAVPTVTAYAATELAFNGKAYECYLCHRTFSTLKTLNTHLSSPAHDAQEFKCPHDKCKRKFKVLSALIRHIESECCGLAKLQSVRKFAHALTGQFSRMLTL